MTDKEKSKRQSRILIGFALILIALIMVAVTLRTPVTLSPDATTQTELETSVQVTYPLDINTATVDELMTIDGIGEKKAQLIIAYREKIGNYTSLDELKNIKGFDDATVKNLARYLTV